jgi:hypothetical protein
VPRCRPRRWTCSPPRSPGVERGLTELVNDGLYRREVSDSSYPASGLGRDTRPLIVEDSARGAPGSAGSSGDDGPLQRTLPGPRPPPGPARMRQPPVISPARTRNARICDPSRMTMRSLQVTAQPRPSRPPEWEKGGRDGRCSRPGAGAPSLVAGTINAGGAAHYFPAHRRSESSRGAARRARPGSRSDSERDPASVVPVGSADSEPGPGL